MRFQSVVAHAFGPLVDETLELAPGMNVVYGPNEAGKSSWHAALYASLCGIRRGGGRRREDREFADRHRPWNSRDTWEVSAVMARDNGVRVELRHDLAARTGTAQDADTGRNYAPEIIRDGAPDGAVWLRLDRRSFLSTACVRQADIVGVLGASDSLQGALQRAADTAGTDATAAAAIDLLENWRRDQVGSARASTRPRAVAKNRLEQSRDSLVRAREAHGEYLHRRAEVERLHAEADQHQRNLTNMESPGPVRNTAENADLAAEIQTAISAWSSRPQVIEPAGPPVANLLAEFSETGETLARLKDRGILWRRLLMLAVPVAAATILFAYVAPVYPALAGLALLAGGLVWRHRRSRQVAMLEERRTRLADDIGRRREDDERYGETVSRHAEAENGLRRAADRCGISPGEPKDRARGLKEWLRTWREELRESEQRQRRLEDLRRTATAARNSEERARGELREFARNMPDVFEAEEAEQSAELEYNRLRRLDATLGRTLDFLRHAEERVHRDMAPRLRRSVCRHLSRITGGRYTDCRIDPQSLAVEVRSGNGPWRRARWLSHGTAEQIYLLLRMALAEHLSAPDETCPLILDDPIATSDASRRESVLETLLAVSESTQVILFTHDQDTRDWARQRLTEPTGRLQELDRTGIPA